MNILDMGTEFLIPSYPFVYLQADNPCWEVAWELSENPETRSARGKLRSAPPPSVIGKAVSCKGRAKKQMVYGRITWVWMWQ